MKKKKLFIYLRKKEKGRKKRRKQGRERGRIFLLKVYLRCQ